MPSKQVKLESSDRHHAIITEVGLPMFHLQLNEKLRLNYGVAMQ